MREVELPDGQKATIIGRRDLTVRTARAIERAKSKTLGASVSLANNGYRPEQEWPKLPEIAEGYLDWVEDPDGVEATRDAGLVKRYQAYAKVYAIRERFSKANLSALSMLTDGERDALDQYENELVINMVVNWTYEFPCTTENIESMNGDVFEQLAAACQAEYDGSAVDVEDDPSNPLATTDGSPS